MTKKKNTKIDYFRHTPLFPLRFSDVVYCTSSIIAQFKLTCNAKLVFIFSPLNDAELKHIKYIENNLQVSVRFPFFCPRPPRASQRRCRPIFVPFPRITKDNPLYTQHNYTV